MTGTISTPSETDIPDDAASWSLNLDPVAEDGKLIGVPEDLTLTAGGFASAAQPEITVVECIADDTAGGNSLDGKYFDIDTHGGGKTQIWFDTNASGSAPTGSESYADVIEVTQVGANDSAERVAIALASAINEDAGAHTLAVVTGNTVTITDAANQAVTTSTMSAGDTGFTVTTQQVGASGTSALGVAADKMAMINDDGTHRAVYFDVGADLIKRIDDIHGTSVSVGNPGNGGSAEDNTGVPVMQVNNKEVHIGMGNGATNKPRWCGIIPHGQFGGSAPSGLQLADAELTSPTLIPNFHKVVSDGTYIYGFEYGSNVIHKLLISDYSLYKKEYVILDTSDLIQFTAMALASDGDLWMFDISTKDYDNEKLGNWMKVSSGSLKILEQGLITTAEAKSTYPNASVNWEITDMLEVGSYLWFTGAIPSCQMPGGNWLFNTTTSSLASSANVEVVSRGYSFDAGTGGITYVGEFEVTSGNIAPYVTSPGVSLVELSGVTTKIGCALEFYDDDGSLTQPIEGSGKGIVKSIGPDEVEGIGAGICIVAQDANDSDYPGQTAGSGMIILQQGGDAIGYGGRLRSVTSNDGVMVLAIENSTRSTNCNFIKTTQIAHTFSHCDVISGMAGTTNEYDLNSARFCLVDNSSNVDVHAFSGAGNGRWMNDLNVGTVNFSTDDFTIRMETDIEITLTNYTGAPADITSGRKYYYKASYLYDGYQESPMGDFTEITSDGTNIKVLINIHNLTISDRISHVNLYMASSDGGSQSPDGFYRLVNQFELDATWDTIAEATQNPAWGSYEQKQYIHNGGVKGSYESLTGLSEVLLKTLPNYGLSAQLNSQHFIADCSHTYLDNADLYVFKSKPYNFDQFDWSVDLLRLPTKPTALAAFNGRLYAFDENNTYRIEPNSFYIEDIFEGAGCIGPDAFVTTEYGMCYADKNNIYLHDGRQPVPIGDKILKDSTYGGYGWQDKKATFDPKVMFDAERNSFIILGRFAGLNHYFVWAFNITRKRWDLWQLFGATQPKGLLAGKNGEIFISDGTNLKHYLGHASSKRAWSWYSKSLTMGHDTQVKKFRKFRVTGSPSGSLGNTSTGIYLKIDGSDVTESGSSLSEFAVDSQNGKNVQWRFVGQTADVDAVGTVYRRKPIK